MNRRMWFGWWLSTPAIPLLAACTPLRVAGTREERIWAGRLSVRIESEPAQGYSAGFELRGDPRSGKLMLLSPVGSTLARLVWSPSGAELASDGETRRFESVAELTRAVTGAELPLTGLFAWLDGASAVMDGWTVLQDERSSGRLRARRDRPAPAVELRVVLD